VNADFVRCLLPEPCVHLISDAEADAGREAHSRNDVGFKELWNRRSRGRECDRFVNPDVMLGEPAWRRSLLGE
jgi:hypothetical protein